MEYCNNNSFRLFLFLLLLGFASSSHISKEVFDFHGPVGRSLLQQKTNCPVNMEQQNYTIVTSQCKGPHYTKEHCCTPLKEMLCPIRDEINDVRNNCMETWVSFANLYGKYPPGLFSNLCIESKEGLDCEGIDVKSQSSQSSAFKATHFSTLHSLVAGVALIFLLNLY